MQTNNNKIQKIINKNISLNRIYVLRSPDGLVSFFDANAILLAPKEALLKMVNITLPSEIKVAKKWLKESMEKGWEY